MIVNQMSNWETWDPFREINQLQQEINRVSPVYRGRTGEYPKFNVWENNDGLLMEAELPGMKTEDLDIVLENDTLRIKGSKKAPETGEKESFVKRELIYGNFSRALKLPYRVDPNTVKAKMQDGILTIALSRPEEEKPKKIIIASN